MEECLTGYLDREKGKEIIEVIVSGGVVVLPTDTLYGFHCSIAAAEGIERIIRFKRRGGKRGFVVLASEIDMVDGIVSSWTGDSREVLSGVWPAALTAILHSAGGIPEIVAPDNRIAVRIPEPAVLRYIISSVGEPLLSTSVNISGRRPFTRISEIIKAFPGADGYISKRGRAGLEPSTIVDFTSSPPSLVRAGKYPWK